MPLRLAIAGMRSVHCVRAVHTALGGVEGVTRAEVSMGRALVEHDGRARCAEIAALVALAGYEVTECTEERRSLPLL